MVRDPPRKSEQATHWAVCRRARRAQLRRPREPRACTEQRLRDGRRQSSCLWVPNDPHPQWERQPRLLAESGSSSRIEEREGCGYLGRSYVRQSDYWKGGIKEMELGTPWQGSECMKERSAAYTQKVVCKVMWWGTEVHIYLAESHSKILLRDRLRNGVTEGVAQYTCAHRHLWTASLLDYCIRSFLSLGSHELCNIRYTGIHCQPIRTKPPCHQSCQCFFFCSI